MSKTTENQPYLIGIFLPMNYNPNWEEHENSLKTKAKKLLDGPLISPDGLYFWNKQLTPPQSYIGASVAEIFKCSVAVFGQGWENAKGCQYEFHIALQRNIPIIFEMPDGDLKLYTPYG